MTPGGDTTGQAIYRFQIGAFDCAAVNNGTFTYTADQYFSTVAPHVLAPALPHHALEPDRTPSPYTCLLVDTGTQVVVVDTGGDRAALQRLMPAGVVPDVGYFAESFACTGLDPDLVERVIITHAHPDHIGGNTDAAGAPRFPNARISIWREEWEYWTSATTLAAQPPLYADPVRKHLLPLADRVDLLDHEGEIVPGIAALQAPGHTPGHIGLSIQSGGEELLYISDAALHPLHLEHPDWSMVFDMGPARALGSRKALFDRAADNGALVLAFHFHPFPSLGHVRRAQTGWIWHPSRRTQ